MFNCVNFFFLIFSNNFLLYHHYKTKLLDKKIDTIAIKYLHLLLKDNCICVLYDILILSHQMGVCVMLASWTWTVLFLTHSLQWSMTLQMLCVTPGWRTVSLSLSLEQDLLSLLISSAMCGKWRYILRNIKKEKKKKEFGRF